MEDFARDSRKMNESELVTRIETRARQGINHEGSRLAAIRGTIMDRYYGLYEGRNKPPDHLSAYKTREIMQTVEWMLPAVLKFFVSHGAIAQFKPDGPEDEAQAELETRIINRAIMDANGGDGFVALYTFCKDALMMPTAYAMIDIEEVESHLTHSVEGVPEHELAMYSENPDYEIVDGEVEMVTVPDGQGGVAQANVYDIRYRETTRRKEMVFKAVPPEDLLVDGQLTQTSLDEAKFVCYRMRSTYSDLVKMGYDKKKLNAISSKHGSVLADQYGEERLRRYVWQDDFAQSKDPIDPSMRHIEVLCCWLWVDYDGDGEAEFRRVDIAGHKVLRNEETDYMPFVAMSSQIMQHSHVGYSIAQAVESLEDLRTSITRAGLNSLYNAASNKPFISQQAFIPGVTASDLQDRLSTAVRVQGNPNESLAPGLSGSLIPEVLPLLDATERDVSLRTGAVPQNSTDPSVMQGAKTGAFMGALDKSSERLEAIVRVLAETGIKTLMQKAHHLVRKNPDFLTRAKIGGQWLNVSADQWPERRAPAVKVGLGFNNREMALTVLQGILEVQREAMESNLSDAKGIFNTLQEIVRMAGLGEATLYFLDPNAEGWQPPQPEPSPEQIVAEASKQDADTRAQTAQAEMQLKIQELQVKMQEMEAKAAEAQVKAQATQQKAAADAAKAQAADAKARADAEKAAADAEQSRAALEAQRIQAEAQIQAQDREDAKLAPEIAEIIASTELKEAQADKARADAKAKPAEVAAKAKAAAKPTPSGGKE